MTAIIPKAIRRPLSLAAVSLAACPLLACSTPALAATASSTPQMCAYSANSISSLNSFAAEIGRTSINCALAYGGGATWSSWESPWYLNNGNNSSWAQWVRSAPTAQPRTLIISMPMIADSEKSDANWRAEGAAGSYEPYDTALARNLVAAGLQNSIIVLAPEANGTWEEDNIGSTPQQMSDWVSTWRNTVMSMRSVPGAAFTFVWTVNNREPAVPFTDYYPGNDVVDVIGDDIYDEVPINGSGWSWSDGGTEGLASLIAFAQAQGKPLGFPEWGTGIVTSSNPSGSDPEFMQGMLNVFQTQNVAFQSYFLADGYQNNLLGSPQTLSLYQSAFSATSSNVSTTAPTTSAGNTQEPVSPATPSTAGNPTSPPASTTPAKITATGASTTPQRPATASPSTSRASNSKPRATRSKTSASRRQHRRDSARQPRAVHGLSRRRASRDVGRVLRRRSRHTER